MNVVPINFIIGYNETLSIILMSIVRPFTGMLLHEKQV